ncbi:hypothetical protein [Xylanimonas ulmi]|uniref:Protein kinase domain-containing protein n=1 Tax=Xylanimonas ulmi TaxID=228973 RepID=A0A4Q7M3W7_9MICO|nr:hypothetical protein [Xylanibacterium ulmi]RZS62626.1 hypothetical protein EV386_2968 [Xylanibacterium ulmi]
MSNVPPSGPTPGAGHGPAVEAGSVVVDRYRIDQPAPTDLTDASAWQATDTVLDRAVRVTLLQGPHAAAALDAARRAALVSDPRLARVLDVGTTQVAGMSLSYVITEPYAGSTLTEIVSSGLVDAQQARAVVGEAAAALDAAAQRGVHHLALRPDAVRVNGHQVLVTGLGIDSGLAGVEGAGADGAAADARDLAALAYYALTARWAGDSLDEPWLSLDVVRPLPAQRDEQGVPAALSSLVPHVDPVLDGMVRSALGDGGGPASPGEVAAALRPWGEVSVVAALPAFVRPAPQGGAPVRQSVRPNGVTGTPPTRRPTGRIPRATGAGAAGIGAAGAAAVGAAGVGAAGVGAAGVGAVPPPPPPPPGHGAAPAIPPGRVAPRPTGQPGPPWPTQAQPAAGAAQRPPAGAAAQGFATESAPRRRGVNPTPIVLGLVLVGLILGGGWAITRFLSPFSPVTTTSTATPDEAAQSPDGEGTTDSPQPEQPAEVRPVIAGAEQVGPAAACSGEQPETAALAVDSDPSTFWFTCTYATPTFGGLKDGIGFTVHLREPAPVNSITLLTNSQGGRVEVRKTTTDSPTEGEVLAEATISPTTELTFSQPVVGDSFVLWMTELPQTGGQNRLELNEITVQ